MEHFEIIQRIDGRLVACVVMARDAEDAQEVMIDQFEAKGLVHGEIILIEAI